MLRLALPLAGLTACVVLVGGCVDPYYQTRYIPTAEEIRWDAEYKELPWQSPDLIADDIPRGRNGRAPRPGFAPALQVDTDDGVLGYHFVGSDFDPSR